MYTTRLDQVNKTKYNCKEWINNNSFRNIDAHLRLKIFIKKNVSRLDITVYDLRMTCKSYNINVIESFKKKCRYNIHK